MCDQGLLIRGEPQSGWKSNIHTYYSFDEYFPDLDLNEMDESSARKRMVEQYITSYGPVSARDISWWTGFPKGEVNQLLDDMGQELATVRISDFDGPFIILASDEGRMNSVKSMTKPQVSLLPALDPYMMGYKERGRFLDEKIYDFIYDRSGNATYSVLIDGRIEGVWDWTDQKEPTIKYCLFKDHCSDIIDVLHSKAIKMGRFLFDEEPKIIECDSMTPLSQRTMGGFISPLKSDKTGLKK